MGARRHQPATFIGHKIAGYTITDFIDAGAMARVFRAKRAYDASIQAPDVAAIKLLAPPFDTPEEEWMDYRLRFAREAEILRRLKHPSILPLIDAGQDADTGWFYLILPFMEGGSLARALARDGKATLPTVAAMLERIAAALDFAHARGLVHRDVKPGNILLDTQGAPYLGDFGLARLRSRALTQWTTAGRAMGSPAYMAPEQFTDASGVGPRADLYGLGMVAYQMVTGHVAHEAENWPALYYKILNEAPISPRRARPDLLEPAAAAIMNALEKDPERRLPSAGAFARAFALGLRGEWADDLPRRGRARIVVTRPVSPSRRRLASIRRSTDAVRSPPQVVFGAGSDTIASDAPTWAGDAPASAQIAQSSGNESIPWRDVTSVVAAALLALLCLAGIPYLAANGSTHTVARQPVSHTHVGASVSHIIWAPPRAVSVPQPPPTVSAPRAPHGGGGKAVARHTTHRHHMRGHSRGASFAGASWANKPRNRRPHLPRDGRSPLLPVE
jgi:serine/threonine protein kinase